MINSNYGLALITFAFLAVFSTNNSGVASQIPTWKVTFEPTTVTVQMNEFEPINVTITGLDTAQLIRDNATVTFTSASPFIADTEPLVIWPKDIVNNTWNGTINIRGQFLGSANIFAKISVNGTEELSQNFVSAVIVRPQRFIDHAFTVSVACLVSILYINFGAAIDLSKVKGIILRPVGPLIAMFCQFLFMPVASYLLGLLLFPNSVEMQLGLFFTGVSPSGGASNVWCVILGGNLDLSIAMTTISTFSAFAIMPIWVFTLGRSIFSRGQLVIPYARIATLAFGLLIPLCIGLLIQKYLPRLAKILVRILKSFSALLIVFIILFAIITNLYLFKLFSWQIILAGLSLPWLGYIAGWTISRIVDQPAKNRLAIAVEAGIQNTGIAIFILRFALGQPAADLTTIIPVSVAIMTPLPLLGLYIALRCRQKLAPQRETETLVTPKGENGPPIITSNRADAS